MGSGRFKYNYDDCLVAGVNLKTRDEHERVSCQGQIAPVISHCLPVGSDFQSRHHCTATMFTVAYSTFQHVAVDAHQGVRTGLTMQPKHSLDSHLRSKCRESCFYERFRIVL